ncbi:MAG TPA: hypothetical protein VMM13_03250, partial [Euzebya sp.]|nr:hypothetical protein [Euzebya sp.]
GLDMAPSNSAIVALDRPGGVEALQAADIACAGRAGRLRVAFHLYSTAADVDLALEVLSAV